MKLETTCKKIKNLEIQGATKIAVEALKALSSVIKSSKAKDVDRLFKEIDEAKKKLFATRPTEPLMRNFLNFMIYNLESQKYGELKEIKKNTKSLASDVLKMKQDAKKQIQDIGKELVKSHKIIYTHCHSSTVTGIINNSAKRKKLEVYNTETRPLFQGRITAKELSKKVPVTHFIDSAARLALKKADIMLIGADAITPTGIYNKIGSNMFAEIANKYDVPVYVCSVSWKFDPETLFGHEEIIEMRNPKEVWKRPPKNVKIINPAFEKVDLSLVTGIISELGITSPTSFCGEMKKSYPWMFKR